VGFLTCIVYNLLVMVLCAGHAIKTRNLPANFNEAKFITFSVYTTILLWLSFFPTYFTAKKYETQVLYGPGTFSLVYVAFPINFERLCRP
jgi:hypothetical protein